jgi:hypothetical protein
MSILSAIGGPLVLIGKTRPALFLGAQTLVFSGTLVLPIVWYTDARWLSVALHRVVGLPVRLA